MTDETVSAVATEADPLLKTASQILEAPVAPKPAETHESLLQRIEHAVETYGSPAYLVDWLRHEIAKFRAG